MDDSILFKYGLRMIGDVETGGSESGSTQGLCGGALVLKQSSVLSHVISAGVDARLFYFSTQCRTSSQKNKTYNMEKIMRTIEYGAECLVVVCTNLSVCIIAFMRAIRGGMISEHSSRVFRVYIYSI